MARLAIFLGSFLLFGVQPLVGGLLLPYFGGTSTVWTVCLCSFQTLLVAGYFYAHVLATRPTRNKILLHAGLIVLSALALIAVPQFAPRVLPQIASFGNPAVGTLLAVLLVIGLPYVLLSSNSSIIQSLVSRGGENREVYGLYAVGNAGSLCGLLSYPFVFESHFSLPGMFVGLGFGLVLYASLVVMVGRGLKAEGSGSQKAVQTKDSVSFKSVALWFSLSGFSCFLLNAVSTQLGQGVSPIPLMWILLLSAYLVSWIIGFSACKSAVVIVASLMTMASGAFAVILLANHGDGLYLVKFILGIVALTGGCTVVHDSLYRLRPRESRLTLFYLMIAVGGAAGGLISSLVVPFVSTFVVEYPIAVVLAVALASVRFWQYVKGYVDQEIQPLVRAAAGFFFVVAIVVGVFCASATDGECIDRSRNFYSVTSIQKKMARDSRGMEYPAITMDNNGITHGLQATMYGSLSLLPTTYYSISGGGMGIVQHPLRKSGKPIRAALCGMGIGTLAAHGRSGDYFRYYEIDPDVIRYATNTKYFTFLSSSHATVEIVEGDARQALEKERDAGEEKFDLIVVDVFSGDSIPVHMATREAFQLYLDRLAPEGILAVHLSNWHLDLSPLMMGAAQTFDLQLRGFIGEADPNCPYIFKSYWAYLSRKEIPFSALDSQIEVDYSKLGPAREISDSKHSLLPFIGQDPISIIESRK